MQKYKNDRANILLEVLLMLAILIVIFPMLQKNVKERSDTLRNQLVVKDMMKIKSATENYLKMQPDIPDGVMLVPFTELEKNGLPKNFKNASGNQERTNILGQNYRVKVKRTTENDGTVDYDAIIIADGNPDISDMRIREIVKESKGFGGYLEDGMIYGTSWALDPNGWGEDDWKNTDAPSSLPIIFKIGFAKKDYQYISRNGIGSSTMMTDLFMNLNNIEHVNNFVITKGKEDNKDGSIEVNDLVLYASGLADIGVLSVDEMLTLNSSMDATDSKASVSLIKGINQPSMRISDTETKNVSLSDTLRISENLTTSNSESNHLSFVDIKNLMVNRSVDLIVGGLIKTPELSTIVAQFGTVDLSSVNIDALNMQYKYANTSTRSQVGFVFDNLYSKKNKNKYYIKSTTDGKMNLSLSDVIVKRVNDIFTKDSSGNTTYVRVGDIIITEKTPISVILRALSYEYADIYRIVKPGSYSGMIDPMPGLEYDEYLRCNSQQCSDKRWSF